MSNTRPNPARRALAGATLSAALLVLPVSTYADVTWTANTGSWSIPANWSTGTLPASTDSVYITNNDATVRNVTLDVTASLVSLRLGNAGSGTTTFNQTSLFNINALDEMLGYNINSYAVHRQSAGNNTYTRSLYLGYDLGSTGIYNLSGSATLTATNAYIGDYGRGSFNQSGGQFRTTSYLDLAENVGATGFYTLSAGTFSAGPSSFVGSRGVGAFLQSGGSATFGEGIALGAYSSATGTYNLSGSGIVTMLGSFYVGGNALSPAGAGILNIQAGTMTVTNTLKIWNTPGTAVNFSKGKLAVGTLDTSGNPSLFLGNGTTTGWSSGTLAITGAGAFAIDPTGPLGGNFTLSGNRVLTVSADEYVGNTTNSTFNQTGGTHNVGNFFWLGKTSGSTGVYNLSGSGQLTAQYPVLGASGVGIFNQSGGRFTINGYMEMFSGAYNLSGSGTITGVAGIYLRSSTSCTFNQSGGQISLINNIEVGGNSNGTGVYLLSGGTLSAGLTCYIGDGGNGLFNQTGGSATFGDNAGIGAAGTGTFNLSGSGSVTMVGSLFIGGSFVGPGGTGILNIQAGAMNVATTLKIWDTASSAVNLSGGLLSVGTLDTSSNPARFNWTGGTFAVTGSGGLTIGGPASPLSPNISFSVNNNLSVTNTLTIQNAPNTTFILNGGSLSAGTLYLSGNPSHFFGDGITTGWISGALAITGASGITIADTGPFGPSISLSSGKTFAVTYDEAIGHLSNGTINQTGGTHAISGFLDMALSNGDTGVYNLSGSGSLTVLQNETIGFSGVGIFNQSGGTHTVKNGVSLHSDASRFNLSGGVLLLTGKQDSFGGLTIDGGVFNLTGSGVATFGTTPNFPYSLRLGNFTGHTATFNLNGAGALLNIIGYAVIGGNSDFGIAPGILNIQAGTMNVTTYLKIWDTPNSAVNLSGGYLSAGTLAVTGQAFNQTGGILTLSNLTQTGGNVAFGGPQFLYNIPTFSVSVGTSSLTTDAPKILVTSNLSLTGTAHVDLTTNDLLLHSTAGSLSSTYTTLKTYLTSGKLFSSSASSITALALMKSSDYLTLHPGATFANQTLTQTDLLIKYTYYGDADLDGLITMSDYSLLEAGFLLGNFNPTTNPASWVHGDFNYDGKVDMLDYALIDSAFQAQSGTLANDEISAHTTLFGTPYTQALDSLSTPVPEPASLSFLCLCAPLLLRRRKSHLNKLN